MIEREGISAADYSVAARRMEDAWTYRHDPVIAERYAKAAQAIKEGGNVQKPVHSKV